MISRPYQAATDQEAAERIWGELHWIEHNNAEHARLLGNFLDGCHALVAEVDGQAECLVTSMTGNIRHLDSDLPLAIVASVTTGLVTRKRKLASRLTARLVAEDAADGLITSALGMFEQGYYSRLGFGTGPYEHSVKFNPAHLNVTAKALNPVRLTPEDYREIHQAQLQRWRGHGGVQVANENHTQAELGWTPDCRGLGFRNADGELTHFLFGSLKGENGPFRIKALAYRNREQLLELLALLRGLGDQFYLVSMLEPAHVQLQDLITEPLKRRRVTRGGDYHEVNLGEAFWQLRINDLAACLEQTHLPARPTLSFNLELSDPISQFLEADQPWQGIGGEYTVHLGQECQASSGSSKGLPLLKASVAGFSRLWLGCASATAIAMSGELSAPQPLLDDLEACLSLPRPRTGWEF